MAKIVNSPLTFRNRRDVVGLTPVETVINNHLLDLANPHAVTKLQVGLGNVNDTADVNKPVSTAQQTALDLKVDENTAITAGTNTKITYDSKGLITSGTALIASDIPALAISGTTGLQTALDGKVDDSQVLTDVPTGALFTDTVYDDTPVTSATSTNTVSTIVKRDVNGDFSAGTITADIVGNADTATGLSAGAGYTGDIVTTSNTLTFTNGILTNVV